MAHPDEFLADFHASQAIEFAERARTAATRREQAEYERKSASEQRYSDLKRGDK